MTGVCISTVSGNGRIGDRLGLRTKFYDSDWEPADFRIPPSTDVQAERRRRYWQGLAVQRDHLPECAAVWNEKRFKTTGELFFSNGFLVAKENLANLLAAFDLGRGGLVRYPIYKADLKTPYPGAFFIINFGAVKNSLDAEKSKGLTPIGVDSKTGQRHYVTNSWPKDFEIALSSEALVGADIWSESRLHKAIFMSAALTTALKQAALDEP